jgi:hypothetical protein
MGIGETGPLALKHLLIVRLKALNAQVYVSLQLDAFVPSKNKLREFHHRTN